MTRRDLLKLLLTSVAAEATDFEKLLWVPGPIVTVPEMPYRNISLAQFAEIIDRGSEKFWRTGRLNDDDEVYTRIAQALKRQPQLLKEYDEATRNRTTPLILSPLWL